MDDADRLRRDAIERMRREHPELYEDAARRAEDWCRWEIERADRQQIEREKLELERERLRHLRATQPIRLGFPTITQWSPPVTTQPSHDCTIDANGVVRIRGESIPLSENQAAVLVYLAKHGPATFPQLQGALDIDRPDRVLKRLVESRDSLVPFVQFPGPSRDGYRTTLRYVDAPESV